MRPRNWRSAAELNADSKLYRNNLAAVYVDQGKYKEALKQLTMAHGEAVGHYNLGYYLTQKNQPELALAEFRQASEKDPNLAPAQQWIAKLSQPRLHSDAQLASGPISVDNRAQMASIIEQQRSAAGMGNQRPFIGGEPPSTFRFVSSTSARMIRP